MRQPAWLRRLAACLPPAEARLHRDSEDAPSNSAVAAGALAGVRDALADGRGLAEACCAVRDLAASQRNQDAMSAHGGWGGAQRAGALENDEADAARRSALSAQGGIPLLLQALRVASAAAAPGGSPNSDSLGALDAAGPGGTLQAQDGSGETSADAAAPPGNSLTPGSHNPTAVARPGETPRGALDCSGEISADAAAAAVAQALRYLALAAAGQAAILSVGGVDALVAAVSGGERTAPGGAGGEIKRGVAGQVIGAGQGGLRTDAADPEIDMADHEIDAAKSRIDVTAAGGEAGALNAAGASPTPRELHPCEAAAARRAAAAGCLANLAFSPAGRYAIFTAGGVSPLVSLCREGDAHGMAAAAAALFSLSLAPDLKIAIVAADGATSLVFLTGNSAAPLAARAHAARALVNLASEPDTSGAVAAAGGAAAAVALAEAVLAQGPPPVFAPGPPPVFTPGAPPVFSSASPPVLSAGPPPVFAPDSHPALAPAQLPARSPSLLPTGRHFHRPAASAALHAATALLANLSLWDSSSRLSVTCAGGITTLARVAHAAGTPPTFVFTPTPSFVLEDPDLVADPDLGTELRTKLGSGVNLRASGVNLERTGGAAAASTRGADAEAAGEAQAAAVDRAARATEAATEEEKVAAAEAAAAALSRLAADVETRAAVVEQVKQGV